jgi:hypothetical protein
LVDMRVSPSDERAGVGLTVGAHIVGARAQGATSALGVVTVGSGSVRGFDAVT